VLLRRNVENSLIAAYDDELSLGCGATSVYAGMWLKAPGLTGGAEQPLCGLDRRAGNVIRSLEAALYVNKQTEGAGIGDAEGSSIIMLCRKEVGLKKGAGSYMCIITEQK
jgi:hypothetical protein